MKRCPFAPFHPDLLAAGLALALLLAACAGRAPQAVSPTVSQPTAPPATAQSSPPPVTTATTVPTPSLPSIETFAPNGEDFPLPPADTWLTYSLPEISVKFDYPANWFVRDEPENQRISLFNAPPDSALAIKGYADDLLWVHISREAETLSPHPGLEAYVKAGPLANVPPENVRVSQPFAVETPGHSAYLMMYEGLGLNVSVYVTNGEHVARVQTSVVSDRLEEKVYMDAFYRIARNVRLR